MDIEFITVYREYGRIVSVERHNTLDDAQLAVVTTELNHWESLTPMLRVRLNLYTLDITENISDRVDILRRLRNI